MRTVRWRDTSVGFNLCLVHHIVGKIKDSKKLKINDNSKLDLY